MYICLDSLRMSLLSTCCMQVLGHTTLERWEGVRRSSVESQDKVRGREQMGSQGHFLEWGLGRG